MSKTKYKQAAAFCYRKKKGKIHVLMITSRDTKQWILPKGWVEDDMSEMSLATLEADEEAGVVTYPEKIKKIGHYLYNKRLSENQTVTVDVNVYSMPIRRLKQQFKEKHQRKRKLETLEEAVELVTDENLEQFLRKVS